jgi:hypothetical protein
MIDSSDITFMHRGKMVSVPAGQNFKFAPIGNAITFQATIFERNLFTIGAEMSLGEDGSWQIRSIHNGRPEETTYLAFRFKKDLEIEPSDEQRAALAELYLNGHEFLPAPNAQICGWAFKGMSPQEVSDNFGDGRKVYLAGGVGT